MVYIISKDVFGDYGIHDIQSNSCWNECPVDGYAVIPDDMVEEILATKGCCDIVLNEDGTEVVSFTAKEFPDAPDCIRNEILHTGNMHLITPQQIGAALAGYGLGEGSSKAHNWNAHWQSGFYREKKWTPTNPTADIPEGAKMWYGITCVESGGNQTNIAFCRDVTNGLIEARRYKESNTFGEWEYVNPPMLEGVEYRTTERFGGKSVFLKNVGGVIQYRLDGETDWKPYANAVGAAPAGYGGYGEVITPRYAGADDKGLEDESALEEKLNEILGTIVSRQSRRFIFLVKKLGDVTVGSWGWVATIYKSSGNYAVVEAASGFGTQVSKITKVFNDGTWQPAEWVNPPLAVGVEYRTTEKFFGEPVYAKVVDFGAGPTGGSKSVYVADHIGDVVRIEGYWCNAAKTSKRPFATTDFIDSAHCQRSTTGGKTVWNLHVGVNADCSSYNGLPVVYYTKREV